MMITPGPQHASGWRTLLTRIVLVPIHLYRATAAMRGPRCRFSPSCSSYAVEAITVHGPARGGWLAIRRLGRCHPWNPGGVDHVPPRSIRSSDDTSPSICTAPSRK